MALNTERSFYYQAPVDASVCNKSRDGGASSAEARGDGTSVQLDCRVGAAAAAAAATVTTADGHNGVDGGGNGDGDGNDHDDDHDDVLCEVPVERGVVNASRKQGGEADRCPGQPVGDVTPPPKGLLEHRSTQKVCVWVCVGSVGE